jgi:hypothetical protein
MTSHTSKALPIDLSEALGRGISVGLAGGLSEVAVISLYGAASGKSATAVAAGIATAAHLFAGSATAGLAIHMGLAVLLGIGLVVAARLSGLSLSRPLVGLTIALGTIWAVNFLLVLPVLSPTFVLLMPPAVTLLSKLMFGVAAATVWNVRLRWSQPPITEPDLRRGKASSAIA